MFKTYLKVCELLHELDKVKVLTLKNINELPLTSTETLTIPRGSEIDLPYWLSKELCRKGFCELREVNDVANLVSKFRFLELSTSTAKYTLHKIPKDLYFKIRKALIEKRTEINESHVYDLGKLRLNKIIDIARLGVREEILQNTTVEERIALYILSDVVNEWINFILGRENCERGGS